MVAADDRQKRYAELLHAMQTGVAHDQATGSEDGTSKHLRVGVNHALCLCSATVKLMVAKGVITEDEWLNCILKELQEEVERYEQRLSQKLGVPVRLV